MLRRWLFRTRSSLPSGPPRNRAYVIGDVHGRADLLEEMLGRIEAHNKKRPPAKTSIVFLGDLIDRGPGSAAVLERLRTYRPAYATPYFIAGNHEEVFLRILDGDTELLANWLRFGGAECARSYGLDTRQLGDAGAESALEQLRSAVPKEHVDFVRSFVDSVTFGSYLLVHAGIRPGIPLDAQVQRDLRWIRSPFLAEAGDLGYVVVHGHTICEQVEVRRNRIGIDTGAYRTGVLTALVLEEQRRALLQTAAYDPPQPRDGRSLAAREESL